VQLTFNTNLCGGKPLIVKEFCVSLLDPRASGLNCQNIFFKCEHIIFITGSVFFFFSYIRLHMSYIIVFRIKISIRITKKKYVPLFEKNILTV
jgi:hypothetical protein